MKTMLAVLAVLGPVGTRDEWSECLPIQSKRLPIVPELRPAGVSEPVVLLVEDDPQGAAQADHAFDHFALKFASEP
jgi:hypothetical protein